MSNLKFISLLLILSSGCCCWAQPITDNEVISQEATAEYDGNNELLQQQQQFAPVVGGAFYKQRRAYYASSSLPHPAQLWRSSLLRRFYNMYPDLALAAAAGGAGNYYSNEVLPLSTYEIVEPETMY